MRKYFIVVIYMNDEYNAIMLVVSWRKNNKMTLT